MNRSLSLKELILAVLAFVAATYFLWTVLEPWLRIDIWLNNDNRNYHPDMIGYGMHRLIQGEFPLWNPHQAGGLPFFAALQGMVLYPPTWLALIFPAEVTHVLGKFIHLVASGISIYFFLRVIKLHPLASFLAGLFFMTGNFFLVFTVFETASYPLTTIGFLLGAIEKILQTDSGETKPSANRWSLFFVFILTLQVFAGYIQSVVFIAYFLCLYLPFRIAQQYVMHRNIRLVYSQFVRLTAMALLTLILSAVQLLPTFEMSTLSFTHNLQEGMDLSRVNLYFLDPLSFAETLNDPIVPIAKTFWGGIFWLLVLIGLVFSNQLRAFTIFFIITTLVFLTMARGTGTWLYELYYYYLPSGNWFRWPEKFLLMSNVTISVLVGVGVHHCYLLIARYSPVVGTSGFWTYCFLVFGASFIMRYSTLDMQIEQPDWHWNSFGKQYEPFQATRIWKDLGHAAKNPPLFKIYTEDPYASAEQAFDYIRNHGDYERTVALLDLGWIYVPDQPIKWGMREQVYSIEDYEPLGSARYKSYMKKMGTRAFPHTALPKNQKMTSLFGARWLLVSHNWLTKNPRKKLPEDLSLVYSDEYYLIYEFPDFLPRAYVASNVISVPEEEVLNYISSSNFDPFTEVLVSKPIDLAKKSSNEQLHAASIVEYQPEKVVIELPSNVAEGVLVLTDSYDSNWQVTVDGDSTELLSVNYVFRGVEISPHNRQVVFSYQPVSVYWGAGISIFGVFLIVIFHLVFRHFRVEARKFAPAKTDLN